MMVIGRALMAKPKLLLLDEPSLGIAPKLVQDIARSIVAINRDEKVSRAPRRAELAHGALDLATAPTRSRPAASRSPGASKELLTDDRIKAAYLGGDV